MSKHLVQGEFGEKVDWREGTAEARPNFRARTRTGTQINSSVELHHEQDW